MNLYLVQHGIPVTKEVDPDKRLSDKGREHVERMAQFLKSTGVEVQEIWQSGKTRARETAEIMASKLTPGIMPLKKNGISPLDDVEEIATECKKMKINVMVVGHLPHLGKLTALLTTGNDELSIVKFEQGGVVCLEREEQSADWVIAWMLIPKCLER